jgi:hypothetical protein
MTELIIKNDIEKKKMDGLLLFLKSWDIDAEIISVTKKSKIKKVRIVNKPDALSDEQSSEIIMHIPSSINIENIQRIIDLMAYKETVAHSQATQDDVDRIAKEAKKGWWLANRERFIK